LRLSSICTYIFFTSALCPLNTIPFYSGILHDPVRTVHFSC
jgi:hypothetical protein